MAFTWHFPVQPTIKVPLSSGATINRQDAVSLTAGGQAKKLEAGEAFAGYASDNVDNQKGDQFVYLHVEGIIEVSVTGAAQNSLTQTLFMSDSVTFTLTATSNSSVAVITEYMGGTTVRAAIQTAFHKQIG